VEVKEEALGIHAAPMRAITMLFAKRLDVLNKCKGIRGSLLRFCIIINAPSRAEDVNSKGTVWSEVHPTSFAVTIALTNRIRFMRPRPHNQGKLYMQTSLVTSLARVRYELSKMGTKPSGMAEAFAIHKSFLSLKHDN
jgi:hypothetical protein